MVNDIKYKTNDYTVTTINPEFHLSVIRQGIINDLRDLKFENNNSSESRKHIQRLRLQLKSLSKYDANPEDVLRIPCNLN
jgi:hypothetical protein